MKRPFVLFNRKKAKKASVAAVKRLEMPMRDNVRQCEWLAEPSNCTPEQSLGIAVLQRAVLDLITPGVLERDRIDAEKWVSGHAGEDFERNYALSFSRIVEGFTDISVEEFRVKILTFAEQAKVSKENADGFRFQRS